MPKLLFPDDAAGIIWLPQRKLVALARARKIGHVLINGQILFTPEDLAAFVNAHRVPVVKEASK